jgi:hypothetical protein
MKTQTGKDYSKSGLTIQYAMLDQYKRFPDKKDRPDFLLWGGFHVHTADGIPVPKTGHVRGEFLSWKGDVEQGFDIDIKGWVELGDGKRVRRLRTWNDPRLPSTVAYPFHSKDGFIWVWNVYKMKYPGGQVVEERWTENAGMWVEEVSPTERIYHCSHGRASPPDFESLVFKITLLP